MALIQGKMNLFEISELNYSYYSDREWPMRRLLDYEDLMKYINGNAPSPTTDAAAVENWTKNCKTSRIAISMKVKPVKRINVQSRKTAKKERTALYS